MPIYLHRYPSPLLWEILCSSNRVTVSVYIVRVFSSIEHQVFFIRTSRCNNHYHHHHYHHRYHHHHHHNPPASPSPLSGGWGVGQREAPPWQQETTGLSRRSLDGDENRLCKAESQLPRRGLVCGRIKNSILARTPSTTSDSAVPSKASPFPTLRREVFGANWRPRPTGDGPGQL